MEQERYRKCRFFISYTRDSGEDFAIHLRESLEKRNIPAFLDIRDIPKKFRKTDEWWKCRDEAIRNSETMLLVITHGFERSEEVMKEISLAFDEKKGFMLLRHRDLDHNIIIDLKDGQVNLGDYNQISFDTKHELLRKVLSASVEEKIKPPSTPSIEKRKTQKDKVETVPPRERKTQEIVLLPDSADITRLSITNDLLNQIYEQAHRQAIDKYNDAQLSAFIIQVFPFADITPKVNIYLWFYSRWADKLCRFRFSDKLPQVENYPPDKFVREDRERVTFVTLPWKKSPQWMQFLNRVYSKIGPFASASGTYYQLNAFPPENSQGDWIVSFDDHFTGKEYAFEWNGKKIDDQSIKQVY